jgi:hypothetical protein
MSQQKCPYCVDKSDEEAKNCLACGGTRAVKAPEPEEAGVRADDPLHIDGL